MLVDEYKIEIRYACEYVCFEKGGTLGLYECIKPIQRNY